MQDDQTNKPSNQASDGPSAGTVIAPRTDTSMPLTGATNQPLATNTPARHLVSSGRKIIYALYAALIICVAYPFLEVLRIDLFTQNSAADHGLDGLYLIASIIYFPAIFGLSIAVVFIAARFTQDRKRLIAAPLAVAALAALLLLLERIVVWTS